MRASRNDLIELLIVFLGFFLVVVWNDAKGIPQPPILTDVLPDSVEHTEPVTMLFAGDVMLGRQVGKLMAREGTGYPFARITSDIKTIAPDLFIANLEGPITTLSAPDERISPERPYSMRFFFDPSVMSALSDAGFTHLSVANNHAFDQGREGAIQTKGYLDSAGIVPLGYRDGTVLGSIAQETRDGHDLAFVALDTTILSHDPEELRAALARFPADTFVTVFMHWGEEYEHTHSPEQEAFAHLLIDSGADLVIGSHPHVVQDKELYKRGVIFYSLGNFVFDQYWNEDVQTGLMVLVTLDEGHAEYREIPLTSAYSQPSIAGGVASSTARFELPID